jgi:hypothetical protein
MMEIIEDCKTIGKRKGSTKPIFEYDGGNSVRICFFFFLDTGLNFCKLLFSVRVRI